MTPSAARYYIATVSYDNPAKHREVALGFRPDGKRILSLRRRRIPGDDTSEELLVDGVKGWWEDTSLDGEFFNVREAVGEIFSGEDGVCWVSSGKLIEIPPCGFVDFLLMPYNRWKVGDLQLFLRDKVIEHLHGKLEPWHGILKTAELDPAVVGDILHVLSGTDLISISDEQLASLVPHIKQLQGMRKSFAACESACI